MSSDQKSSKENSDDAVRNADYDPFSSAPGTSIPLLVKLPDGERRQVDFPPNSSIRDLKVHIASLTGDMPAIPNDTNLNNTNTASQSQAIPWDLDFGGSVLNENHTLEHYHIPDAYDHANGLLKTISDSGYDDPDKKVEAVDKAVTLVRGISRGERDMERLIMSVYEEGPDASYIGSPTQPSLNSMRRSRRSKIPSINLAHLPPIGSTLSGNNTGKGKLGPPSAPPTPSQLIRRLSNYRPDLYDPKVIDKVTNAALNPATSTAPTQTPALAETNSNLALTPGADDTAKNNEATAVEAPAPIAPTANKMSVGVPKPVTKEPSVQNENTKTNPSTESGVGATTATEEADAKGGDRTGLGTVDGVTGDITGSGELKRQNTWFADIMSSIGHSITNDAGRDSEEDDQHDVDGDSEGEASHEQRQRGHHMMVDQQNGDDKGTSERTDSVVTGGTEGTGDANSETKSHPQGSSSDESKATEVNNDKGNGASNNVSKSDPSKPTGTAKEETKPGEASQPTPAKQKQVIGLEPEVSMTAPSEQLKIPKKRGRKRKNPHLTEEERKAQRQAQNRESAKLSRIRRKNMTIEYEKRVNTLEGENENLRDTVAALTGRLEMLQNLLTISVQKRAMPDSAITQLATAQQQQAAVINPSLQAHPQPMAPFPTAQPTMAIPQPLVGFNPTQIPAQPNATSGMTLAGTTDPHGVRTTLPPTSGSLPNLDFNNL